jgi:diguanylate cyclase (GGDEF)-like protein
MTLFQSAPFKGSGKDLFTPTQIQHLMRVEFDRAQRYKYPIVMLLIGIDRLPQLQDLYGSELKDEIQRALVGLLKGETRASDSIGCLVDDRILALVPHTPPAGAAAMAKRIVDGVRTLQFECDGRATRVTVSIGGAHNARKGELAFDTMVEVAEGGLKVAREGGGNRFVHSDLYEFFERKREREERERNQAAARAPVPQGAAPGASSVHAGLPVEHVLGDKIRELFGLSERDSDMLARIEQEVIASALREMKAELEKSISSSQSQHQRQIETLERRIGKLSDALGMTESELQRVLHGKSIDPGVASIYKSVQGLSSGDVQTELKKTLMAKIFEANVELKNQIGSGGPGAGTQ